MEVMKMGFKSSKKNSISSTDNYLRHKAIEKSVCFVEEAAGVIKLPNKYGFDIWVFMDSHSHRVRYRFMGWRSDE
ncbi:MAG: hypothetical protein GY782_00425 [Gammaproteobacteria bacterium]|nr:hypothetical protein [Gammaproteobacteria bacterium]